MTLPTRIDYPGLDRERRLARKGFSAIAGLDEAGRGAWAGPLSAAAVVLPLSKRGLRNLLRGVRDSKKMTFAQRSAASSAIRAEAIAWSVAFATAREVDLFGPVHATQLAMERAIDGLSISPDHLLIDFLPLPKVRIAQSAFAHGESISLSIAAASVLAKVWRDEWMQLLNTEYPAFGFAKHKGYGTAAHRQALLLHGPCLEHRQSYAPIREITDPDALMSRHLTSRGKRS